MSQNPHYIGDEFDSQDELVEAEIVVDPPMFITDDIHVIGEKSSPLIIADNDIEQIQGSPSIPVHVVVSPIHIEDDSEPQPPEPDPVPTTTVKSEVEILEGPTDEETKLRYRSVDYLLAGIGGAIGIVGSGLGALVCYNTQGLVEGFPWLGPLIGGGICFLAGLVMTIFMLNMISKWHFNRKQDRWKSSVDFPDTSAGILGLGVGLIFDPGILVILALFFTAAGGAAVVAMNSMAPATAALAIWLGVPLATFALCIFLLDGESVTRHFESKES